MGKRMRFQSLPCHAALSPASLTMLQPFWLDPREPVIDKIDQ
ncbi:MAG: hypothetical protein AAF494_01505 [Pseudomonadota bacterium]